MLGHTTMVTIEPKYVVGRLLDVPASAPKPGRHRSWACRSNCPSHAVQKSLQDQGRQRLQVSEKTLLDQLADMGALVDRDNQPITAQFSGERTYKERLGSGSVRLARVPISFLPALEPPPVCQNPGFRIVGG